MRLLLEGVTLRRGEFTLELDLELDARATGVFGPSGAGKTSLVELVAGLLRPRAGRVVLDDEVLDDPSRRIHVPPERRRVGLVPQDGALFPHMSVNDNVLYGAGSDPRHHAQVVEALDIGGLLERWPASLSGGEKRRVALARALLASPRLLLLDEPMAGLDLTLRARILPYLLRVRDDLSVPFLHVSHDPSEVAAACQEVLLLDRGRLVGRGRPTEML